jgi:hypothetical protein
MGREFGVASTRLVDGDVIAIGGSIVCGGNNPFAGACPPSNR